MSSYDQRPWVAAYDSGVFADIEIPDTSLLERFKEIVGSYPQKPATFFYGEKINYEQLLVLSTKFASALQKAGCNQGDVVGINLPNLPQYLIAQMGIMIAGCVASGMSPLLTPPEIVYQLNDCRAKALVTLDAILEHRLVKVIDTLPDLKIVVVTGILDFLSWPKRVLGKILKKVPTGRIQPLAHKTVLDFKSFLSTGSSHIDEIDVKPGDLCLLQYTGGTTGMPKGTMLTHGNLSANLAQIDHWVKPDYGQEVCLSGFPLFHLAGLALSLASVFMGAAQILIPNPRDTKHIAKEIAKYQPTMLVNVPSLYMMLHEEPLFRRITFSRLSFALSGASPFPEESIKEIEAIIGHNRVLEVYGMTEASPIITMNPRRGKKKPGTVGVPVSSTRVRVVDLETGTQQVPIGQEGELIVCGPQVMKGYYNKPEETDFALRIHDGEMWLHTGDVVRMDDEGYVTIVDRLKDMLNVGGFKVFSREVEEKLYSHPAIEFCAIIGIPNLKRPGSEIVKLVVQPSGEYNKTNHDQLRESIIEFAKDNLAPYKVPKIIEFVQNLPLTPVGKVDKKALRK
ncbi:MAG: AMP-dependent synthetase [Thermodesulfobacteriota bacterium]|nr:AMP-dependent synthetase [Thermodesulfobacteriota bacterium]